MRVFTANDKYVRFAPRTAEDQEAAEQASDYVNYIITQRNDGYKLLHTFFKDALLFRMGVIKFFYETKEEVDEEEYSGLSEDELKALSGFGFLSLKPRLILLNTGEENMAGEPSVAGRFDNLIAFCASVEQQITELDPAEQGEFLEAMGIEEPAREKFIHASYSLLELISFFTVVSNELRAWTVNRGTEAVHAAGKIHSDIERGFIRAEVVNFEDFIKEPSMARLKELGKLRLEGKNYIVQDGDIINFRFNV